MAREQLVLLIILLVCGSSYRWALGYSSPSTTAAMPICAGSGVPVVLPEPLGFCGVVGLSCCDSAADAALREEFQAMVVPDSDAACKTMVQAILCSRCIPSPSPQPLNAAVINSIPPRCSSSPSPPSALAAAAPQTRKQDAAVCLERLAGGSYLGMAAHPDGSGRAFLYTQQGKIWLVSVPARASGASMQVGGDPFVDLTDRALLLLGLAPHPEVATNGRFFISYACDTIASPACAAGAPGGYGSSRSPCRYLLVVEEFTTKGVDYGMATQASPTQAKRIFTMGLPHLVDASSNQQNGGQIFFRPGHGYLYLVTARGGGEATSPFLGKIVRFDVGRMPPANEPEIFATGLDNPRGCSIDSQRPSYLYCAAVDEQQNEQIYLISSKAGSNYSAASPTMAAVSLVVDHGHPRAGEAPSVVGGHVYRGSADPVLRGRYLYMYGSFMWEAVETPASKSNNGLRVYPSSRIPNVMCSGRSPVTCRGEAIAGSVVSIAQDNSMDAFVITTGGIYRVIPPGLCGGIPRPPPSQTPSWFTILMSILGLVIFLFAMICSWQLCSCCGAGGGDQPTNANWSVTCNCFSRGTTTTTNTNNGPTGGGGGGETRDQVELTRPHV